MTLVVPKTQLNKAWALQAAEKLAGRGKKCQGTA
jgi:hypothetical protein